MLLSDEELQRLSPVPLLRVRGDKVTETWEEQRRRPGVTPVLLGNREASGVVLGEGKRCGGTVEGVLKEARELDLDSWMAERIRSRPERFNVAEVDQPWDGVRRPITPFVPAYDHRGDPLEEVFFALIPAEEPWQVPAHLRSAGLQDLPAAAVHTALYHRWQQRHGAVVCTIAEGAIELQVDKPLPNMEVARQVAIEQFIYCPDLVHQGLGTIGNLAGVLMSNTVWYFWWAFD